MTLAELRDHITKIVDYNWTDELADYVDHPGEKETHIFPSLVALDNFINGTDDPVEVYVEDFKKR